MWNYNQLQAKDLLNLTKNCVTFSHCYNVPYLYE